MNGWNALWGLALVCVFGISGPGYAQDAGDGDPGGGSDTSEPDNRPGDSNDNDAEPPGGDEDFGDTWEPEPGSGEDVDDRDVPGSDGSAGGSGSSGGSDVTSDQDAAGSPTFEEDSTDSDWNHIPRNQGRG